MHSVQDHTSAGDQCCIDFWDAEVLLEVKNGLENAAYNDVLMLGEHCEMLNHLIHKLQIQLQSTVGDCNWMLHENLEEARTLYAKLARLSEQA